MLKKLFGLDPATTTVRTEIVAGIKKIFDAMDRNTEVTEQLNETAQKFKSL